MDIISHHIAALPNGVNTYDPGAFGCSMTSEHTRVAYRFAFTPDEVRRLTHNATVARFTPTLDENLQDVLNLRR